MTELFLRIPRVAEFAGSRCRRCVTLAGFVLQSILAGGFSGQALAVESSGRGGSPELSQDLTRWGRELLELLKGAEATRPAQPTGCGVHEPSGLPDLTGCALLAVVCCNLGIVFVLRVESTSPSD